MFKNNRVKVFLGAVSLTGLMLLNACSSSSNDSPTPTTKSKAEYAFSLTSAQIPAIPAISSSATGSATLSLDESSGELSGFITLSSNIVATAAHIHQGDVGVNGPVVVTLIQDTTNTQRFIIPMNTILMTTQIDELVSGHYYINVHTATNPSGELRGQILASNYSVLVTELSTQQLPILASISSTGTARGFLAIDSTSSTINGVVRINGIVPTAMHIHSGYLGTSGGPVVTLTQSSDPNVWEIPANSMLNASQLMELGNGKLYYNIHTAANMSGELHGQIKPDNVELNVVNLMANPGVSTTAQGKAFISLNIDTGLLNATVKTSGITVTNMHIHDSDNAGAVVKALTATADSSIWNVSDTILTSAEVAALTSGVYYVNVHSSTNPTGEISATIE